MKSILITGAAGFVGQNLAAHFTRHGFQVVGVDVAPAPAGLAVRFHQSDFADDRILDMVRAGTFDCVMHQAAISSTMETDANLLEETNVVRTMWLADACAVGGAKLIYASSSSVYGTFTKGVAVSENDVHQREICSGPLNLYAKSKLSLDTLMANRAPDGLRWAGLRYTNVFGPGERQKGSMASILSQLLYATANKEPIRLFVDTLEASRDYVPVEWVAQTHHRLGETEVPSGIYNVGSGHATTFATVLTWCVDFSGHSELPVLLVPNPVADRYQYWTCADMAKLHSVISMETMTAAGVRDAAQALFAQMVDAPAGK